MTVKERDISGLAFVKQEKILNETKEWKLKVNRKAIFF